MTLIIKTTGWQDYVARSGGAYIKALILGEPDSGKTRSASFWPDPIFADCEQGRMSIADRQVAYAEIRASRDMDALLLRLKQECTRPAEARRYRTLVIDTIDSYQRTLIRERLAEERKEMLSGWADWGFLDAKMQQLLQGALNLPMHVVVNCHIRDEPDGDEESRMLIKKPKLKGDIKDQLAAEFDIACYLEKNYVARDGQRVLQRQLRCKSEPRYPMSKDRSGRLPRFIDITFSPADFDQIYNAIVGQHVESFPEGQTVEELDNGEVTPVPPDVAGGPLSDVEPLPVPRKAAAKKAVAAKKEKTGANSVPDPEPAAEQAAEKQPEPEKPELEQQEPPAQPETRVAANGSATAAGTGAQQSRPRPAAAKPVCGDQPKHWVEKFPPVEGCGKDLANEERSAVNLSASRFKTYLCAACWDKQRVAGVAG